MSIFEYDQEKHMRQEREDAWADARLAMIKKMLENGVSEEDISHMAGASEEEIERAKNPNLIREANGISIFEYDQEKHMRQERAEAWADGHNAGLEEARLSMIIQMLKNGMSEEEVSRVAGASEEEIKKAKDLSL